MNTFQIYPYEYILLLLYLNNTSTVLKYVTVIIQRAETHQLIKTVRLPS